MPSSGDGTGYNEAIPAGTDPIYLGALEIREVKKATNLRIKKEHDIFAASTVGGEHKTGSAMAYALATASAPTLRPDAATAFTSADVGRVWYDTTLNVLKILVSVGAVTWETIGIPKDTIMFFYADDASALPGWTIYTTVVDCVLGLKGGSNDYNDTGGDGAEKGGDGAGGWGQTGHTHGNGNLSVASHVHGQVVVGWGVTGSAPGTIDSGRLVVGSGVAEQTETLESLRAGGAGNPNTDSATSTVDGGVTSGGARAVTWRPLAALGILCKKD